MSFSLPCLLEKSIKAIAWAWSGRWDPWGWTRKHRRIQRLVLSLWGQRGCWNSCQSKSSARRGGWDEVLAAGWGVGGFFWNPWCWAHISLLPAHYCIERKRASQERFLVWCRCWSLTLPLSQPEIIYLQLCFHRTTGTSNNISGWSKLPFLQRCPTGKIDVPNSYYLVVLIRNHGCGNDLSCLLHF